MRGLGRAAWFLMLVGGTPGVAAAAGGPIVTGLIIRPASFHSGTTITYFDTLPATALLTIRAARTGVRSGRACVAPPKHPTPGRHETRCTRYVVAGRFSHHDRAGLNTVGWKGRLHGRKLGPGRYRLSVVAKDAAGHTGKGASRPFTITR